MTLQNKLRFVLINVVPPVFNEDAAQYDLEELKSLVETFGGATIVHIIQRRNNPDPSTYIGSGKAYELQETVRQDRIDIIVLNSIVKPTQIFNLTKILWTINPNIQVWDRVDLILHIFEKHAHTTEAKLQIELARMRHMGPRMFGLGGNLFSRQGAGIGTRGLGETNTELMKRHWRNEMKQVQTRLDETARSRERQMEHRREIGFKTISIIGYTNAGKSTLFNLLAKKRNLAQNILFATLESTIGKLYLPTLKKEVLVSDTIGFIQNLPAQLITAFKSTLMESIHADLLLHVIDAKDPHVHEKIEVVEKILSDLSIRGKKQIYVFNKIDEGTIHQKELLEMYGSYEPQFISSKTGEGIPKLLHSVEKYLP